MNFNYTDRITEAPKFDASNMPRRDEWTDELAFSAVVWLNDCRVWMYRGAWAEWPVEDIEICVPMSPEELMHKRKSILKHSSQMESAPYLGNDSRLFWQRAEDRNLATSRLYDALGLASYEAMEAFKEYHI